MKKQTIKTTAILLAVMVFFCSCATTAPKVVGEKENETVEFEAKKDVKIGKWLCALLGGGIVFGILAIGSGGKGWENFPEKGNWSHGFALLLIAGGTLYGFQSGNVYLDGNEPLFGDLADQKRKQMGQDDKDLEFQNEMNSKIRTMTYEDAVKRWGEPAAVKKELMDTMVIWKYTSYDYDKRKKTYYGSSQAQARYAETFTNTKGEVLYMVFATEKKIMTEWGYSRR